jgi:hypothetical protein
VESDLVAVGVGERECPTEGAVNWCGDDGVTVGDESIVNGLDVCGVEPDRGTDAKTAHLSLGLAVTLVPVAVTPDWCLAR